MKTSIAIVDDHHLVAQALASLIQKFEEYEVVFFAENGQDLLTILAQRTSPDIILLDLVMPIMDGFSTAEQLKKQYPAIKIIALSMHDEEEKIMRMLRLGARGFLPKGCRPAELKKALDDVRDKQYHFSEFLTGKIVHNLLPTDVPPPPAIPALNDREKEFIRLSCSDLTYAEIANIMCVSPRTIDGYRESVFQKLNVKSRPGMVMKAIKLGIVSI